MGAFRDLPQAYWRYFDHIDRPTAGPLDGRAWRVRDDVRKYVRFGQFNLMNREPPFLGFHIVSCRNVLIYFDDSGRRHVYDLLHRALAPRGVAVFVPTEIPTPTMFDAEWGHAAVVYRKR